MAVDFQECLRTVSSLAESLSAMLIDNVDVAKDDDVGNVVEAKRVLEAAGWDVPDSVREAVAIFTGRR